MVRLGFMGGKFIWVKIIWDYVNVFRYFIIVNFVIYNKFFIMDNLEFRGV